LNILIEGLFAARIVFRKSNYIEIIDHRELDTSFKNRFKNEIENIQKRICTFFALHEHFSLPPFFPGI
jgi:hypothetical protein